jgi:hypothetical protein
VFNPPHDACPRFVTNRITAGAGFGHQFTELLFGLWAARQYGYSYVYEPFRYHAGARDDYSVMNKALGLDRMFAADLGALSRDALDGLVMSDERWITVKALPVSAPRRCFTALAIGGYHYCTTDATTNDCFAAPENEFLFQRFAPCLRTAVLAYGKVFDECVLVEPSSDGQATRPLLPTDTVVVVWHVRVGDVVTHRVDDPYYEKVLDTIRFITHGYRVRLVLVGGGTAKDPAQNTTLSVPLDYVKRISNIAGALWASNAVRVDAPSYTFLESFIAMMQADVLVGSGSSLTHVAALLSATPLFFNHVPKHGFHYGAELISDNIDLLANGTVLESPRRLRIALFARINQGRKPCRRPS